MKIAQLILIASLFLGAAAARALEAGAAKVRVLPPPGVSLDGDAERLGRPASGEHDPLWARCLYLHDGERALFLVNVDAYRITRSLRELVVDRAGTFASEETIILTASHTANGPGGMSDHLPDRWYSGRWREDMLETMTEAILTAMSTALEQKRRSTLGYGTAHPRGLAVNRLIPNGPVDDQAGVIRVDDADGKAIAILACFSAAPVLVPETDRYRFSADFPGAYYRKMEELTDPGCVAMFLMGAGGDQHPGNPENKSGWEQVDSVGSLLASSVKAAANDMTFHDSTFKLNHREVVPPVSMASHLPNTAVLQTLEIDGLLLTFIPGMPSAGMGLELRRQALASGYRAQFTVGLANGYLGYFTTRAGFAAPRDMGEAPHYGPEFETWLYREVMALAKDEVAAPLAWDAPTLSRVPVSGGEHIVLQGAGFERGLQRGSAFRTSIQERYADRITGPVQSGVLRPDGDRWRLWPAMLDPAPLALPALAVSVRPLLQALSSDFFSEVEGFAAGADLPFDAAWLLQHEALLAAGTVAPPAQDAPGGAMFGLLGEVAGANAPLVALDLDTGASGQPVVTEVRPEEGHAFVHVGLEWQLGTVAGLNDAGVALVLARNEVLGTETLTGLPAGLLVRQVLQYAGTFEAAFAALEDAKHLRGYHILVVAPGEKGWRGAVVSYGKRIETRVVEAGLLPGVDPDSDEADPAVEQRYRDLVALLGGRERVSELEAREALALVADASPVARGSRVTAMMRPGRLEIQVAFPAGAEAPGALTEIRLKGNASNE